MILGALRLCGGIGGGGGRMGLGEGGEVGKMMRGGGCMGVGTTGRRGGGGG